MKTASIIAAWLAASILALTPASAQVVTNADCAGTRGYASLCGADGKVVPSQGRQIPTDGRNVYEIRTGTGTETTTTTSTGSGTITRLSCQDATTSAGGCMSADDKTKLDSLTVGLGTLWLDDTAADVGGYQTLKLSPRTSAEEDDNVSVVAADGEKLIDGYITEPGVPGSTIWHGGSWEFQDFRYVSNSVGTTQIVRRVYRRTTGGTETEVFNVTGADINDTSAPSVPTSLFATAPDSVGDVTDRLVVKYFAQTTSVAPAITVHLLHNGTAHYSHIETPLELAQSLMSVGYLVAGAGIGITKVTGTGTATATTTSLASTDTGTVSVRTTTYGGNGVYFSGTATNTSTNTVTSTSTAVETVTDTFTATGTGTGSQTGSQTGTGSASKTVTGTQSRTFTSAIAQTNTGTSSGTGTGLNWTIAPTATYTLTGTITITVAVAGTGSSTTTATGTSTVTGTGTATVTATASSTGSMAGSAQTATYSYTISRTSTATATGTVSEVESFTGTVTVTSSGTVTATSYSVTATGTGSGTGTSTHTWYPTSTSTVTATSTATATATVTNLGQTTTILVPSTDVPGGDRFLIGDDGTCERGSTFYAHPDGECEYDTTGYTPTPSTPVSMISTSTGWTPIAKGAGSPSAIRWVMPGTVRFYFWAKTTSAAQIKLYLGTCDASTYSPETSVAPTTTVDISGASWTYYTATTTISPGVQVASGKALCFSMAAYTASGTPTVDAATGVDHDFRVNGPWIAGETL